MTDTASDEFDPVYCPDGSRIAFEGNATGNWDVYVMPAAGGRAVNLTDAPADGLRPVVLA